MRVPPRGGQPGRDPGGHTRSAAGFPTLLLHDLCIQHSRQVLQATGILFSRRLLPDFNAGGASTASVGGERLGKDHSPGILCERHGGTTEWGRSPYRAPSPGGAPPGNKFLLYETSPSWGSPSLGIPELWGNAKDGEEGREILGECRRELRTYRPDFYGAGGGRFYAAAGRATPPRPGPPSPGRGHPGTPRRSHPELHPDPLRGHSSSGMLLAQVLASNSPTFALLPGRDHQPTWTILSIPLDGDLPGGLPREPEWWLISP